MLDYAAIAATDLASISERRIEKLVNPALSELPAFLVREGGLHSGFMIAQVTAAALVSECKVLAHPASVDSIPTSAAKEDHVSMSPIAARKFAAIVENLERVLAIEALAAFQAMEFLRPLASSAAHRAGAGRISPRDPALEPRPGDAPGPREGAAFPGRRGHDPGHRAPGLTHIIAP